MRMLRRTSRRLGSALVLGACAVSVDARADGLERSGELPAPAIFRADGRNAAHRTSPAEDSAGRRRWYGWQTLVSDGASGGLFLTAGLFSPWWASNTSTRVVDGREVCSGTGCPSTSRSISYVLAGLGGAGYFLGAPIVHLVHGHVGKAVASFALRIPPPLILGAAMLSCFNRCETGLIVLAATSFPIVYTIDAAVIAWEDVPQADPRVGVTPWVDLVARRAGLAVGGAF